MHVIGVNTGTAKRLGDVLTGIAKAPQIDSVQVTELGLANDVVCDKQFHGGRDQAVYVYGADDYAYWAESLGYELQPGTFGDNLTISELSSLTISVGDRLHINDVILEATAPRIPCATLGRHMGDAKFPVAFRHSRRSGFYCRVIRAGMIAQGDSVKLVNTDEQDPLAIVTMFDLYYDPTPPALSLENALRAPIAIRDRERFKARLKKQNG